VLLLPRPPPLLAQPKPLHPRPLLLLPLLDALLPVAPEWLVVCKVIQIMIIQDNFTK
jgi:hypothetical protein